jgi:hypothetical protein
VQQTKDKLWAAVDPVFLTSTHTPEGADFATVFYWRDASGLAGHDSHSKFVRWINTDGRRVVIGTGPDTAPVKVDERGCLRTQSGEDVVLMLPRR